MMKLLRSNLSRMARNWILRLGMIASFLTAVIACVANYFDYQNNVKLYGADVVTPPVVEEVLFTGALLLIFVAAVFVGTFLGTDYSCGTLRNKIIAGHSRAGIYLSNLLTALIANIGMLLVFDLASLAVGVPLLGKTVLSVKQIALFMLIQCLAMIAFTALIVFLSMLFRSKAGGSVAVLVLTIVLYASAMIIPDMLRAPEYYDAFDTDIVDENMDETVIVMHTTKVKNPSYVGGIKRDILEVLDSALPVNQFYGLVFASQSTELQLHLGIMAAYSAAITVLITGAGILLFRKKNLT